MTKNNPTVVDVMGYRFGWDKRDVVGLPPVREYEDFITPGSDEETAKLFQWAHENGAQVAMMMTDTGALGCSIGLDLAKKEAFLEAWGDALSAAKDLPMEIGMTPLRFALWMRRVDARPEWKTRALRMQQLDQSYLDRVVERE